jgi:hypothetical protein
MFINLKFFIHVYIYKKNLYTYIHMYFYIHKSINIYSHTALSASGKMVAWFLAPKLA